MRDQDDNPIWANYTHPITCVNIAPSRGFLKRQEREIGVLFYTDRRISFFRASRKLMMNGLKKLSRPKRLNETVNSGENTILQGNETEPRVTGRVWMYPRILPPIPLK